MAEEKKPFETTADETVEESAVNVNDCETTSEIVEDDAADREITAEPTPEQWREALEVAVKQRDEYLQLAQRAQADFANFKRRNQLTRAEAYDDGVREMLAALLPVIDTLDRAIAAIGEEADTQLAEGVKMTQRQLVDAATKMGLEEIAALGEPFDPELHNAVARSNDGEPGTVLEVYDKGYRVKGRIIRYAMVKVAVEKE